ncbi:MAG: phosphoadenosine phosphosulfate reductase family protein [Nitrospirota bacterium]
MEIKEDKSIAFQPLDKKEEKSRELVVEADRRFGVDKIAVAFTGGKDSTVLLHIIRTAFHGVIPFKVFNIDTSVKFKDIYAFRDRLKNEWNLNLIILKNENAMDVIKQTKDSAECCYLLKTKVLDEGIKRYGIKALMTAIRWDEQVTRAEERYFSEREDHIRIHPILHFMEKDIWEYIRKYHIPYCELYDKGYRSLGCEPCTVLPAGGTERSGRAQDKEAIMERLRELGYF